MGRAYAAEEEDLRSLAAHIRGVFTLSGAGRILSENAPDHPLPPRLFIGGCAGGNLVRVRGDVSEAISRAVQDRVAAEPPWTDPSAPPAWLEDVIALASRDRPAEVETPALIYRLPNGLAFDAGATIVGWDTAEGRELTARLAAEGLPAHLTEAGFLGLDDFWEPWCAATEGGTIAAMAFAARAGGRVAEVGVYTFPGFRGRGLAAAVTASWSSLPGLASHTLFYSAHGTNISSQAVARRLGLGRFAVSIRIG